MKLFLTGFLQVFFVSINTYLISRVMFLGVFVCAFCISMVWSHNVTKIVFGKKSDRYVYAIGSGFGSLVGTYLIYNLTNG